MNSQYDIFGKDAQELFDKKLFLFDMDGTIYEENRLFDGTLLLLDWIVQHGGKYVFITNNSSRSVEDYIKKVIDMGIKAESDNFFTSTQATILMLKREYPGIPIFCMGTQSLVEELRASGIEVYTQADDRAKLVLIGYDTELNYEKICQACIMLRKDIPYFATNPDFACPVKDGFVPDCGSICKMLSYAIFREPIYIGKPAPTMVDFVRDKFSVSCEETVVIGDRLYTDIATGNNAKVTSICVLTGEASKKDILEGSIKPTYTFESVKTLYQALKHIEKN